MGFTPLEKREGRRRLTPLLQVDGRRVPSFVLEIEKRCGHDLLERE